MAEAAYSPHEILEVPGKVSTGLESSIVSENNLEIDLSVKCRGCFAQEHEMHYLFTPFDRQLSLADVILQCTQYNCEEDDGYPPYLCTKCTTLLIDFFNFKAQFKRTTNYVSTLLENRFPDYLEDNDDREYFDNDREYFDNDSEYFVDPFDLDSDEDSEGDTEEDTDPFPDDGYNYKFDGFMPDVKEISGNTLQCKLCSWLFPSMDECETHMARDHGTNPFLKYSTFRQQVIDHRNAFLEEKKRKKLEEAAIQEAILDALPGKLCRICKKKFPEDEFKEHWENHKIHVCEQCGHKCIKKSDLDLHRQSVHNNVKSFSCDICDKSFKVKPLLKRHYKIHMNPRSYCCDLCGQRFNDSGTLKTHIHLKHYGTRDYICPICGHAFTMKSTLDKHIKRHDKNRLPSFFCDLCDRGFQDKSSLKRHHFIKHTNDFVRPSCDVCGKTYCSTSKLRCHIENQHLATTVEKKKRGRKKLVPAEKYHNSESTDTDEFGGTSENEAYLGAKVLTVAGDFFPGSPIYSLCKEEEDDPDYGIITNQMLSAPGLHCQEVLYTLSGSTSHIF